MKKSCFILFAAVTLGGLFLASCKKNQLPVIDTFAVEPASDTLVTAGDTVNIICDASDPDGDSLFFDLKAEDGMLKGTPENDDIIWIAPNQSGTYEIICNVTDLEEDTVNQVSDTLGIQVQNYFPIDTGYYWHYDGFIWLVVNVPKAISRTVYSRENLAGGEVRWHLQTQDSTGSGIIIDSLDYYSVKGNSVFESVRIYTRLTLTEGLLCETPLWKGKTWEYNEDNVARVKEIQDEGPSALSYACIEIVSSSDSTIVRTVWFAPDVGIVEDKRESSGSEVYEFELDEYRLD